LNQRLTKARDGLIEAAGRTSQGLGLGRIIGQIYALLYFSISPLSLDEIAEELQVSKASVSVNIRELSKWSAVRKVWVKASRRDYYEAEADFSRIALSGLIPFIQRKLDSSLVEIEEANVSLDSVLSEGDPDVIEEEMNFFRERLGELRNAREKLGALLLFLGENGIA